MESMSMVGIEEYRLLFFQPDPEAGERICVGVAVDGELLYSADFSRVQSFSQKLGPEILNFYLKDIRERIIRSHGEDLERIVKDYAPMFIVSAPRKVVSPVNQSTKLMLLRRFVNGEEHRQTSRMRFRKQFFSKLKDFAYSVVSPTTHQIIENARPVDIFGETRKGFGRVGRIALAVKRENHILLMDGLDLNPLRSQDLLRACTQVVHTFWQYGRVPRPYGETLSRVAVLFNGSIQETAKSRDAHAFALDQFRKESDATIEASSPMGAERLAGFLT
jgi:hypothetical protein